MRDLSAQLGARSGKPVAIASQHRLNSPRNFSLAKAMLHCGGNLDRANIASAMYPEVLNRAKCNAKWVIDFR
jgi:hypothetical protein